MFVFFVSRLKMSLSWTDLRRGVSFLLLFSVQLMFSPLMFYFPVFEFRISRIRRWCLHEEDAGRRSFGPRTGRSERRWRRSSTLRSRSGGDTGRLLGRRRRSLRRAVPSSRLRPHVLQPWRRLGGRTGPGSSVSEQHAHVSKTCFRSQI